MKKLLSSILIVATLEQALYGACPSNVTLLKQGDKTPCAGFLFSPETAERATKADMQYQLLLEEHGLILKQIELYKNINKDYESILLKEKSKTDLWQTKAESYAIKYSELQDKEQTKSWLYFALGIITTVAAGYSLGQASKGK
jgi:hypothetical protein